MFLSFCAAAPGACCGNERKRVRMTCFCDSVGLDKTGPHVGRPGAWNWLLCTFMAKGNKTIYQDLFFFIHVFLMRITHEEASQKAICHGYCLQ